MSAFKMSNLFAKQSELTSSESSDSSDDEKKPQQKQQDPKIIDAQKKMRKAFESSDESEEEQRVVRTQKDKRQEVFDGIIKDLKNHLKISDFTQIITDFERLAEEIKIHGDILFSQGADGILPL